jgi:putative methyltransferase (TIGR04325 family)
MKSALKKLLGIKSPYGFFGFYKSWDEAKKLSTGWSADNVLSKVKASLLKIKNGQAVYERDSALFDKPQYSWPLLASLQRVALEHNNELNVLDFGGSLGTTYFQNRKFLSGLKKLEWNIVEQKNYAVAGRESFENEELHFFDDWDMAIKNSNASVLVVSSVIQYLEKPFGQIEKFLSAGFEYIIFDRTSFIDAGDHKIAIQKVKPSIYETIFPIWFFNYEKFLEKFRGRYDIIAEFPAYVAAKYEVNGVLGGDRGFILKKKV